MKTLQDKLKALPADRRNKTAARTDELIREETDHAGAARGAKRRRGKAA